MGIIQCYANKSGWKLNKYNFVSLLIFFSVVMAMPAFFCVCQIIFLSCYLALFYKIHCTNNWDIYNVRNLKHFLQYLLSEVYVQTVSRRECFLLFSCQDNTVDCSNQLIIKSIQSIHFIVLQLNLLEPACCNAWRIVFSI